MEEVPRFYGSYAYTHGKKEKLALLLENCALGDLFPAVAEPTLTDFTHEMRAKVIYQLVSGLKNIHAKKILHRDLKPENIFLTSSFDAKIADFGFGKTMDEIIYQLAGSPNYSSPEMYKGKTAVSDKCDVWALGMLIFIVKGVIPFWFRAADSLDKLNALFEGKAGVNDDSLKFIYPKPKDFNINDCWKELLSSYEEPKNGITDRDAPLDPKNFRNPLEAILYSMFTLNPSARPTSAEVYQAIEELKKNANGKDPILEWVKA